MVKGLNTRFIVNEILFSLKKSKSNYDDLLSIYIKKNNLSFKDINLVHTIVLSSMRFEPYVRKILTIYVKKKINIRHYLLFLSSITQIVFLDFKEYATVNCTVELAKNKKINVHSGFINAVLKQIIKDKDVLLTTTIDYNYFPKWFIGQTSDKSKKDKRNFVKTIVEKPSLHIVFKNNLLLKKFNYENFFVTSSKSLALKNYKNIEKLPRYKNGDWWIQDYISMLPISLINNINNKLVADLCGAPGGKAFQLLSNRANLDIFEINAKRAEILEKNLKRLNYNSKIYLMDSLNIVNNKKYDIVVIDPPCSAVGTIRRNPEIFFRDKPPNFKIITKLQNKLLNKAKDIVKKRGIIIYMVCSFLNLETVNLINKFLRDNSNFSIKKFIINEDKFELIDKNGFINTLPKNCLKYNIDGFFAAKLIKND